MNVVFRVDASVWIGSGHVMRCLVLADELKSHGYRVSFACLPQKGDMISYIESRGFEVVTLTAPSEYIQPTHEADYCGWLQRSVCEDARDFLSHIKAADLVVTDHYAIESDWQKRVRSELGCHLIAIDDLARTHDADLIIDQTLGRDPNEYTGAARALTGSDYALLAPNFLALRERGLNRVPPKEKPRVLISMGGIDKPNATLSVLKALVGMVDASFTVLLSTRAPHYQEVKAWCHQHDDVEHKEFESNMAELMLQHDIAIGAPGTTSWERACLGLPSILIPLAENQSMICAQLLAHQAILKVTLSEIKTKLLAAYEQLISGWATYHTNNLRLCDGLGLRRVVLEIQQMLAPKAHSSLQLRRARRDDIDTVYHWQCHPKTREYALNATVPSWDEHKQWMTRKLDSVRDYFYIVIDKQNLKPLGVVRLDNTEPDHYLVSIYVAPESYGKGVAIAALSMVDELHPEMTLHATVLKENVASQKLFQKANYTQLDAETYIRYPI